MADSDHTNALLHQQCDELLSHVKLFRDYATTPNSGWLAKGELNQIQALISEIEQTLQRDSQSS